MALSLILGEPDRDRRHQLTFELVPAAVLAATTQRWTLVAFASAVLLPATRQTWVRWIRSGFGLLPIAVAMLLVSGSGRHAVITAWAIGCAAGIARLGCRSRAFEAGAGRGVDQRGPRTRT